MSGWTMLPSPLERIQFSGRHCEMQLSCDPFHIEAVCREAIASARAELFEDAVAEVIASLSDSGTSGTLVGAAALRDRDVASERAGRKHLAGLLMRLEATKTERNALVQDSADPEAIVEQLGVLESIEAQVARTERHLRELREQIAGAKRHLERVFAQLLEFVEPAFFDKLEGRRAAWHQALFDGERPLPQVLDALAGIARVLYLPDGVKVAQLRPDLHRVLARVRERLAEQATPAEVSA